MKKSKADIENDVQKKFKNSVKKILDINRGDEVISEVISQTSEYRNNSEHAYCVSEMIEQLRSMGYMVLSFQTQKEQAKIEDFVESQTTFNELQKVMCL